MADLSNAKVFGGIGALLLLIGGAIPYAGPIVSIIGLVLIFLGVKTISEITHDQSIFKNYLMSFIFQIIAVIAIFVMVLIGFGAAGGFSWVTSLQSAEFTDFSSFWSYFGSMIIAVLIGFVIAWVFLIIGSIYLRKSYNGIAQHTNVKYFETTGTLYFIGAITLIVLVGFLILLIARIFEIISFFSLPDNLPTSENMMNTEL